MKNRLAPTLGHLGPELTQSPEDSPPQAPYHTQDLRVTGERNTTSAPTEPWAPGDSWNTHIVTLPNQWLRFLLVNTGLPWFQTQWTAARSPEEVPLPSALNHPGS